LVFVPLLAVLTVIVALGMVYLLSALTIVYRDFRYIVPVGVQLMMYLSPVVYPVQLFSGKYQWLVGINPMAGIIDGFRSAILGKPWNMPMVATSVVSSFALLVLGIFYFRHTERRFADIA
jgi:lipopolysaccharide transport system permease protein